MTDSHVSLNDSVNTVTSSLLEKVKSGEQDGWDRLTRIYTPLVYWWCRKSGVEQHASADIGQAVFLSIHRNIDKCHRESFRNYLWKITKNKITDHWRNAGTPAQGGSDQQRQLNEVPSEQDLDSSCRSESAETSLLYREVVEFVRGEFSARDWEIFDAYVKQERTAGDIADEFGVTANTVYLVKTRIIRRVKQTFGELTSE